MGAFLKLSKKADSNPPVVKIECAYVDAVSSEDETKAFTEGCLKKHVPGPPQTTRLTTVTW
jgi:hypothetical protein